MKKIKSYTEKIKGSRVGFGETLSERQSMKKFFPILL